MRLLGCAWRGNITSAVQGGIVIALLDTSRASAAGAVRFRSAGEASDPAGLLDFRISFKGIPARELPIIELLTCYACSYLSEAQDGDDGINGVYTKHLLQVRPKALCTRHTTWQACPIPYSI